MINIWLKGRLNQESMTIKTLSEKTGVSEAALLEIASGSRLPKQSEMCELVKILGMPMNYFLGGGGTTGGQRDKNKPFIPNIE